MKVSIKTNYTFPGDGDLEIVERKGLGHPDTLCDYLAEKISIEYSKYTLGKYGVILHHNLDKIGIRGGQWIRDYGISKMKSPVKILLGGRMSTSFAAEQIDIQKIQKNITQAYLGKILPHFDVEKGLVFDYGTSNYSINPYWYAPRSLEDIPDSQKAWANDTSICVGYYPYTDTERITIELEKMLYTGKFKPKYDFLGQDIKIMATREGNTIDITMCIPFISYKTPNKNFYLGFKKSLKTELENNLKELISDKYKINLKINTNDGNLIRKNRGYLTATGSSIEFGEEGFVGRGNLSTGIISSMRPFSVEAAYGKNPVYHTGRVHGFFSKYIAQNIFEKFGYKNTVIIKTNNSDPLLQPSKIFINTDHKLVDFEKISKFVEKILNETNYVSHILKGYLLPKNR